MLLADGIDLPLLLAFGFAFFALVTLLVTLIESLALKYLLKTTFRAMFGRVLLANVISTIAGATIFAMQDWLIDTTGIKVSIPSLIHGYRWVGPLLVLIYLVQSAFVEGLVVIAGQFPARIQRSRRVLFRNVALANVFSYLVVGPLFYFGTRPTFGHVEATDSTAWTANASQVVYFIGPHDHFIKQACLDGSGVKTLVPYPAEAFVMDARAELFAFRAPDSELLNAYRVRESKLRLSVRACDRRGMPPTAISNDGRWLAFMEFQSREIPGESLKDCHVLKLANLETGAVTCVPNAYVATWNAPAIGFDASGTWVYVRPESGAVLKVNCEPPFALSTADAVPELEQLAENYRVRQWWSGDGAFLKDQKAGYSAHLYPYLGAYLKIKRPDGGRSYIRNDYGVLSFGWPAPNCPSFLPNGNEVLLEWLNQLYILDIPNWRLGLVTNGANPVIRSPRFRVSLKADDVEDDAEDP